MLEFDWYRIKFPDPFGGEFTSQLKWVFQSIVLYLCSVKSSLFANDFLMMFYRFHCKCDAFFYLNPSLRISCSIILNEIVFLKLLPIFFIHCQYVCIYIVLLSNEISKIICKFPKFFICIIGFSLSHVGALGDVPFTNPYNYFLKLMKFHQTHEVLLFRDKLKGTLVPTF